MVHQIPRMAARVTRGSVLRAIPGVFEGPDAITARSFFLGVRPRRFEVLSGRIVCRYKHAD